MAGQRKAAHKSVIDQKIDLTSHFLHNYNRWLSRTAVTSTRCSKTVWAVGHMTWKKAWLPNIYKSNLLYKLLYIQEIYAFECIRFYLKFWKYISFIFKKVNKILVHVTFKLRSIFISFFLLHFYFKSVFKYLGKQLHFI